MLGRLCRLGGLGGIWRGTRASALHAPASEQRHLAARCLASSSAPDAATARLTGRGVVRLAGRDTVKFLQGLITNDARALEGPAAAPLYAVFLTPQGRVLHDIFLHAQPASGGDDDGFTVLGDVDKAHLPQLLLHLKKFKLRAQVDVADVSDEYSVWARYGAEAGATAEAAEAPPPPSEGWHHDPRLQSLGLRSIFRNDATPLGSAAPSGAPEQEAAAYGYYLWRTANGVAEGPEEIPSGEAVPLEYNLAGLNAINFKKGCYLGQELTARSHFRGVVRKRVMPVALDEGPEPHAVDTTWAVAGNSVYADDPGAKTNKKLGQLCTVTADRTRGLALLRLKQAEDPSETLRVESSRTRVFPRRPPWWPATWGREEE